MKVPIGMDATATWISWVYLGALVLGAVVLGFLTRFLFCTAGVRVAARTHSRTDDLLVKGLCKPAVVAIPILSVQLILASFPGVFPLVSALRQILAVGLILVIGWAAVCLVGVAGQLLVARTEHRNRSAATQRSVATRVRLFTRVVNVIVLTLVGAIVLLSIPAVRELGASMLASAGIAGIIAGLAARSVLGNLMAGVQVAINQPIVMGDSVVVDDEFGTIEEITSSYVVMKTWDLRRLIIPVSYFLENRFENWTFRGQTDLIGSVIVYTDYMATVDSLRSELRTIVEASPLWDGKTLVLQVTDATESAMQVRILVSASSADRLWNLRCEVREKIIAVIMRNADQVPKTRVEISRDLDHNGTSARSESGQRTVSTTDH